MTPKFHSLRHRLVLAFASFALLTVLSFGFLAVLFAYAVEDSFFDRMLDEETQRQHAALANTGNTVPPKRELIRIYHAVADLPADLREQLHASEVRHEFVGSEGRHYHVRRLQVAGRDSPVWLVAEVSQDLVVRPVLVDMIWFLIKAAAVLLLLVGLAGYWLARRATAPLTSLAQHMAEATPDHLDQAFAASYPNNEIGLLARHLEAALQRIHGLLQREQQFTRDASHELRTPIAIIRSSAELLEAQSLPATAQPVVQRIHAASVQMQQIVDLLLSLAREAPTVASSDVALLPLIESSVVQHAALLQNKAVEVIVDVLPSARVRTHSTALAIVLDNLLRNAFQYTSTGTVRVHFHDGALHITDSGEGIEPAVRAHLFEPLRKGERSTGFGIGLSLVARLCERYGIRLILRDVAGGGTQATLRFAETA